MKVNKFVIGISILIIIFGGISISKELDLWETESNKIPITFNEGEFKGMYDPSDIRGSYKFVEVSELFNIPIEILKDAFELPNYIDINEFKNKDLEGLYTFKDDKIEIGNGSVKLFVALYNNLPFSLEDDYLLNSGVEILLKKGTLTENEIDYLKNHTVFDYKINSSTSKNEDDEDYLRIKGTTTFKELLNLGINKQVLEEILDDKIENKNLVIKDYCLNKGINFSEVKNKIQIELDKLK